MIKLREVTRPGLHRYQTFQRAPFLDDCRQPCGALPQHVNRLSPYPTHVGLVSYFLTIQHILLANLRGGSLVEQSLHPTTLLRVLGRVCYFFLYEARSNWVGREGRVQAFLAVGVDVRHVHRWYGLVASLQALRKFSRRCGDPLEVIEMCALNIVHLA